MPKYIANYTGFVQATERVFSAVEDDYEKVLPGQFEKKSEDYEFTAKDDFSAIVRAKKELKKRFPEEAEEGMRLTGLSKLVNVPLTG